MFPLKANDLPLSCTFVLTRGTQLQDKQCPFTRRWNAFQDKLEKIERIDSLVNYGLIIMFPLLLISTWLLPTFVS